MSIRFLSLVLGFLVASGVKTSFAVKPYEFTFCSREDLAQAFSRNVSETGLTDLFQSWSIEYGSKSAPSVQIAAKQVISTLVQSLKKDRLNRAILLSDKIHKISSVFFPQNPEVQVEIENEMRSAVNELLRHSTAGVIFDRRYLEYLHKQIEKKGKDPVQVNSLLRKVLADTKMVYRNQCEDMIAQFPQFLESIYREQPGEFSAAMKLLPRVGVPEPFTYPEVLSDVSSHPGVSGQYMQIVQDMDIRATRMLEMNDLKDPCYHDLPSVEEWAEVMLGRSDSDSSSSPQGSFESSKALFTPDVPHQKFYDSSSSQSASVRSRAAPPSTPRRPLLNKRGYVDLATPSSSFAQRLEFEESESFATPNSSSEVDPSHSQSKKKRARDSEKTPSGSRLMLPPPPRMKLNLSGMKQEASAEGSSSGSGWSLRPPLSPAPKKRVKLVKRDEGVSPASGDQLATEREERE